MINLTGRVLYYLFGAAAFLLFLFAYSRLHFYNASFAVYLLTASLNTFCAFGYGFFADDIKRGLSA